MPCLTPRDPSAAACTGLWGRCRVRGFNYFQDIFSTPVCPRSVVSLHMSEILCSSDTLPVYCPAFFAPSLPPPNAALLGPPILPRPHFQGEKKKIQIPCAELTFVFFSFLFLVKYYRLFCWEKKSWYCVSMFLSTFIKHSHFINGKRPQCVPESFFLLVLSCTTNSKSGAISFKKKMNSFKNHDKFYANQINYYYYYYTYFFDYIHT